MAKKTIVGVHIHHRNEVASQVQKVLTECGCAIKTRLGLHEAGDDVCSPSGLLLLEVLDNADGKKLLEDLGAISDLDVQKMEFNV